MIEAKCRWCGETFIPADDTDLIHESTWDNQPCGGVGDIQAIMLRTVPDLPADEDTGIDWGIEGVLAPNDRWLPWVVGAFFALELIASIAVIVASVVVIQWVFSQ